MHKWTNEDAIQTLDRLCEEIVDVAKTPPQSAELTRWRLRAVRFLQEVFGEQSLYFLNFTRISWTYRGTMMVHFREAFTPGATQERYDFPVFLQGLQSALGIFLAAKDELERKGVEAVYEGKDTGPEASLILQVINIAEIKLRKALRNKPNEEREVQDAFETLLVGAEIPYSREKDSIEYSSKKYIPDFTIPKADMAAEIKLCDGPKREKEIIPEINDDILAYRTKYGNLLFAVYDCGFIRDTGLFARSFESHGAVHVRVVKH